MLNCPKQETISNFRVDFSFSTGNTKNTLSSSSSYCSSQIVDKYHMETIAQFNEPTREQLQSAEESGGESIVRRQISS